MQFDVFCLKLLVLTPEERERSIRSEGYVETDLL